MIPRLLRQLYRRAFVERIHAILHRLDALTAEVTSLRAEIEHLRADVQLLHTDVQLLHSQVSGVETEQRELRRQVETVIAAGWDSTALGRRLATLEDRIDRG